MREEGKWERYDEHIGWDCFLVTVQCRVPRFHVHFSLLRHRCQIKFLNVSFLISISFNKTLEIEFGKYSISSKRHILSKSGHKAGRLDLTIFN